MKELGIRNKNLRTRSVIRLTWNDVQGTKGTKKETYIHEKIVIHAVHEIGTIIVNNRNMMQVKNKKKLLGKLNACK